MTDVAELSSNRHDGKHVSPEVALAMAIIEHTEDAVIVKKLDGTVIAWNATASETIASSTITGASASVPASA